MKHGILTSLIVGSCLMLPIVAQAGTASQLPFPASSDEATGLIVSTDGILPADVVRAISLVVARDVVAQVPMGGSLMALRFDRRLPAATVRQLSAELNALPGVDRVGPDLVVMSDAVPDDAYYPSQSNLWSPQNQTFMTGDASPDYSIDAPTMWAATQGRKSVVVALVDGGIVAHADLVGQTVPGYDMIADSLNARDGNGRDANGADPGNRSDGTLCAAHRSSWHGTHVAGIVAAVRDNGIGISGIAPGVAVQSVRVVGQCGASMSDVIAGIRWASGGEVPGVPANPTPADVINVSLSSTVIDETCPTAYQEVVDEARSRGAVVVVSAGNQAGSVLSRTPANCLGALSVGATDVDGSPTSYTNSGRSIGMMAQGGEVGDGEGIWSTVDAGSAGPTGSIYEQKAGTSMAAPAVSAAAALVLSLGAFANDQVVQVLRASAVKPPTLDDGDTCISRDPTTGAERNVCGAGILNLTEIPAPVGRPVLAGGSTVGSTLSFTPGLWNGDPASVTHQWLRNGVAIAGATGTSYVLTGADLARTLTVRSTSHTYGYPQFSGLSVAKAIPRARASVALRLSSTRARLRTTRLAASVTVTAAQGQDPSGTFGVYVDGRLRSTLALTSGAAQFRLPVFATTGQHKVQVRYSGNSRVSYKWSTAIWVSVSR